jgi:DNA ligase (NAD+)
MNIDGLSEKTLKKFIDLGYVRKYKDIYTEIDKHKFEISKLSGFGEKSVSTLIESIEKSKSTTLDKVIVAFNIDGIGKETAKQLSKVIESNISDSETLYNTLIKLDGFGETLCKSVCDWFNSEDYKDFIDVLSMLNIKKDNRDKTDVLNNISFVITGKLNKFSNRDDLVNTIQNNGGLVQNSVTSKTNYLINNDITSNSGKNKKAKELNVSIISEDEFISMLNCNKFNKTKTPKKRGLF